MLVFMRLLLLFLLPVASLEPTGGAGHVEVALGADGAVVDTGGLAVNQQAMQPETISGGDRGAVWTSSSEAPSSRPDMPKGDQPDDPKTYPDELFALQAEIDALDDMIRLQEEKLRVLRELRGGLTSPVDDRPSRDAIERRLDAAVASKAEDIAARHFDSFFVERAAIRASDAVADVKLLFVPAVALDLVVLAYNSGRLEFYTSSLVKIMDMTVEGDVKSIELETYNRQPILVVNHNGNVLSVFALHLTDAVHTLTAVNTAAGPQNQVPGMHLPYNLRVERIGTAQLEAQVAAFALSKGSGCIIAGSISGKLAVFAINGTQLDHFDAGETLIHALASQHRRVAFSDRSNFVITRLGGSLARNFIKCHGSSDIITSIAFDVQQNDIVYAGTSGGDILVFRYQWGPSLPDQTTCQLLSRVTLTRRSRGERLVGVNLKVVKGFVLAAGPSELKVFNISRTIQPDTLSLAPVTIMKELNVDADGSLVFDFAQGVHESSFVYLSTAPSGQPPTVKLFRSLLAIPSEQQDFPWVFAMYIATALVAVVAMQIYSRRSPERTASPWEASDRSFRAPFGKCDEGNSRPPLSLNRGKASSIGSRIARQQGNLNNFAVGEAFEEDYHNGSAYEEDEYRTKYQSFSDELRQHLAASTRKQR